MRGLYFLALIVGGACFSLWIAQYKRIEQMESEIENLREFIQNSSISSSSNSSSSGGSSSSGSSQSGSIIGGSDVTDIISSNVSNATDRGDSVNSSSSGGGGGGSDGVACGSVMIKKQRDNILPPKAEAGWLLADPRDVQKEYDLGFAKCKAYLASHAPKIVNIIDTPDPFKDFKGGAQGSCRGVDRLYTITGLIVYPFGPGMRNCSTNASCWYGLLTCGRLKADNIAKLKEQSLIQDAYKKHIEALNVTQSKTHIPNRIAWSIKSLYIYMRMNGPELVVPDQRYVTVVGQNATETDLIIAQYGAVIPGEYKLEMFLQEFYPGALYTWDQIQREVWGMEVFGNIFLGGVEARCRPYTQCKLKNECCGCQVNTQIAASPYKVIVGSDGSRVQCKPEVLPLCRVDQKTGKMEGLQGGRWVKNKCSKEDLTKPDHDCARFPFFEGEQDNAAGAITFKPYKCRFKMYSAAEARACLSENRVNHIHFQGDSMSRDLYSQMGSFLGVNTTSEEELKRLTNIMKKDNLQAKSLDGKLMLSEGYSWDWDLNIQSRILYPPYPQVIVANHGFAHRVTTYLTSLNKSLEESIIHFWRDVHAHSKSPVPIFKFYQGAKALFGKKWYNKNFHANQYWSTEHFKKANKVIRDVYVNQLGYMDLDEYAITEGRWKTSGDGWHVGGSVRYMQCIIIINAICAPQ